MLVILLPKYGLHNQKIEIERYQSLGRTKATLDAYLGLLLELSKSALLLVGESARLSWTVGAGKITHFVASFGIDAVAFFGVADMPPGELVIFCGIPRLL